MIAGWGDMKRNRKLEEARLRKGWTRGEASKRLGIHENTLLNWELGKHQPLLAYLTPLCTLYDAAPEELGLGALVRSKQEREEEEPAALSTPASEQRLLMDCLEVRLLVALGQWDRRKTSYTALQCHIDQEIRRYDEMTDQHPENPDRRKALQILATLPIGIYGLTATSGIFAGAPEEVLPQCAAGLTTCWHLSKGKELPLVQAVVAAYLPALTRLARETSRHQKAAAGLVAEAHMLAGLLTMHLDGHSASEFHYREAVKYSQLTDDYNLQVGSLGWLASSYRYQKRPQKALEAYKQAQPYLKQVSPLIRSRTYGGFSAIQAQCGQKQDALRSLGLAHESFFMQSETDFSPLYVLHERSTLILMDGRTYNDLGQKEDSTEAKKMQHDKALDSLMQIGSLKTSMQISERIRLEALNNQARAAFWLRDLEQCCTYLESAVTGALLLGSEQRYIEAREIYEMIMIAWGDEPRVKALRELFKK